MMETEFKDTEFENVLIAVTQAMNDDTALESDQSFDPDWYARFGSRIPRPANDNDRAWPLFPFPSGSMSSC